MRLLDFHLLTGFGFPVFCKSCVVVLVELTRWIIRNIEQGNRFTLRHGLYGKSQYESKRDQDSLHHLPLKSSSCWGPPWAVRLARLPFSCAVPWRVSWVVDYSRCLPKKCSQESWQRHRPRREIPGTKRDVRRPDQSAREADRRRQKVRAGHQSAG